MQEERAKVVQMLADGKIGADQAWQLLSALGDADDEPAADPSPPQPAVPFASPWLIPMYAGLVVFVCGALAAFPLRAASGGWLFAACGWPAFVVGLLTMAAGWMSRRARWLHIRVTGIGGSRRNLGLSFPIPLRLSARILNAASPFAPRLRNSGVDEMISVLDESLTGDQPLMIDVQEGEEGERVQVYIA